MPPKKDSNTPPTAHFAVVELVAGMKCWKAGSSGQLVHLKDFSDMPPKTIPRREIVLCGKVLFGLHRFAFEVQEFDNDPRAVSSLLKKGGRSGSPFDDTYLGVLLARDIAPLTSLQVKFDDIEAVERAGDIITLMLKGSLACYQESAGKDSGSCNPKVAKDITQGAKTLQFKIGPANRARSSKRQQLDFAAVQNMIMATSPRLRALFLGQAVPALPPPVTPQKKRKSEAPASIAKRLKKDARGKVSSTADAALLASNWCDQPGQMWSVISQR